MSYPLRNGDDECFSIYKKAALAAAFLLAQWGRWVDGDKRLLRIRLAPDESYALIRRLHERAASRFLDT